MAGQLTLGGMAFGLAGGGIQFGPTTAANSKGKPQLVDIELEAGVEKKVPLPPESKWWALGFETQTNAPTITVKTNTAGDGVMSIPAEGVAAMPIASTTTELAFKAATVPKVFQLFVI